MQTGYIYVMKIILYSKSLKKERTIQAMENGWSSKFLDKVMDVSTDFMWPFLVDEVSSIFHYYHFLQKRHILLESPIVDIFLGSWKLVGQIQIPDDELYRHSNLCLCPWCSQLPSSATKKHDLNLKAWNNCIELIRTEQSEWLNLRLTGRRLCSSSILQ